MNEPRRRRQRRVVFALLILAVVGIWLVRAAPPGDADDPPSGASDPGNEGSVARKTNEVKIVEVTAPRVLTGEVLADGSPETVACGTCHATKTPNRELRNEGDLEDFHQGLVYGHGDLSCLSCHNGDDYDRLRLADGRSLEFPRVMTLCAQCHGPQFRDYTNGSHGGMTGYWDLTKGGRVRNNCITCHDPHAPAYPQVMPIFKPVDTKARSDRRTRASAENSPSDNE